MAVLEIYRHYRMDNGLSAQGVHFIPHLNTCKYGLFQKGLVRALITLDIFYEWDSNL